MAHNFAKFGFRPTPSTLRLHIELRGVDYAEEWELLHLIHLMVEMKVALLFELYMYYELHLVRLLSPDTRILDENVLSYSALQGSPASQTDIEPFFDFVVGVDGVPGGTESVRFPILSCFRKAQM